MNTFMYIQSVMKDKQPVRGHNTLYIHIHIYTFKYICKYIYVRNSSMP